MSSVGGAGGAKAKHDYNHDGKIDDKDKKIEKKLEELEKLTKGTEGGGKGGKSANEDAQKLLKELEGMGVKDPFKEIQTMKGDGGGGQ